MQTETWLLSFIHLRLPSVNELLFNVGVMGLLEPGRRKRPHFL